MKKLLVALVVAVLGSGPAWAVPDTVSLQVADVTTSSLALVWMTNVAATPGVEVYQDPSLTTRLDDQVVITPLPDASPAVAEASRAKGVMKVRVAGLLPDTEYYVRSVTADPVDPLSVGYSAPQKVRTAAVAVPYTRADDGSLKGFANDLLSFSVYLRPVELKQEKPGLGDLLVLETPDSPYPVSAFVGLGAVSSEGILDLNNLYAGTRQSLALKGGETALLRVYRGGGIPTLLHYRRLPQNSQTVAVKGAVPGFFADVNLDGKVDARDFDAFRVQYRTAPDDPAYNPDFKFVADPEGRVDARDFARFAHEYGRADVQ